MQSPSVLPPKIPTTPKLNYRDRTLVASILLVASGMGVYHLVLRAPKPAYVPQLELLTPSVAISEARPVLKEPIDYAPRTVVDEAGFRTVLPSVDRWPASASSAEIAVYFHGVTKRMLAQLDQMISTDAQQHELAAQIAAKFNKVVLLNFDGKADEASEILGECRAMLESSPQLAKVNLYTIIYMQGLVGLRKGENENCILCRGESSCILPIAPAAVHKNPVGSRMAITFFTEYLTQFPNDAGVRWLLNVAHMTLGEHPDKVDPCFLVDLTHFFKSNPAAIGKFRDIGHEVGVNRLNLGGGGIMEDFDGDGLLDIFVSTFDPTQSPGFYRNTGQRKFEDLTSSAGLESEKGGINCMQTDYDNDGDMDVLIVRGAWLLPEQAMPLSLLRNNGDKTFSNVTTEAGMGAPMNSIAASWADFDNDGWLDVFVCSEFGPNRLYRNQHDGTFRDAAAVAGVAGSGSTTCKGVTWIDLNNDGYQDLFLDHMGYESAKLFVNNQNGTFTAADTDLGITGPMQGFSCWSWDYDNDGWLDIFATSYDRTVGDVVDGMAGRPHRRNSNCLYRNLEGKRFEDVTAAVGLDHCYAAMGSNFGDFDNDGFLDMYLGTGDPNYSLLIPNRMIRNVAGKSFVDITASSGTGNLQKGHGTACGDWAQDGNVDLFVQMGGAVNGDKYHNILFQNPGHKNGWVTLKLVGTKENRAAIGARIKVVTLGAAHNTIYRTVCSGSSFGANPLQQTIGLGDANSVERVEIFWPVSGQTQVLTDVSLGQSLTIVEP